MRSPPAAPDLGVVIVNHNTAALLERCLESLARGGLAGLRATVHVVDNASTDGSVELVRRRFPTVGVMVSPANVGYAAANNLALRALGFRDPPADRSADGVPGYPGRASPSDLAAEGFGHPTSDPRPRHVLLLNPDTIVPPGAVGLLVDALDTEPGLGAAGPKLVLPDGTLDLACRRSFPTPEVSLYRFSGLSRALPRSARFGRYNLTHLDPDLPADVDSVVGACMLVRGAAIDVVGLLDERFWMYGEDLDWAMRLKATGWRVGYRPHVQVVHVKRAASRGSARARHEFQRAMWLFYDKHFAATTPLPVHALIVAALVARGGPSLLREMLLGHRAGGA
jgi:GT2 family glycosyltransferase